MKVSPQAKVVHVCRDWPCGGGMGALLQRHAAAGEPVVAAMHGNGPNTLLGRAGARLGNQLASFGEAEHWLHYNGYAIDWPLKKQGSKPLRWIYLHSDYPNLIGWLRPLTAFADGLLTVNAALAESIRKAPGINIPVFPLPLPIPRAAPQEAARGEPNADRPVIIGYAGRIERAQKRLDRLPAFLRALRESGIPYRFHLVGDGPYAPVLRAQIGSDANVHFHGFLQGEAYAAQLRSWDFILFLSDYEGLPIALLEAVAAGVVPIYPDFHGGTDWVSALSPDLFYPTGATEAAAGRLAKILQNWKREDWIVFRERGAALLEKNRPEAYDVALKNALNARGRPEGTRRGCSRIAYWLPLWVHHRVQRFRRFGGHKHPR
jgi:glycosyltransferase involved in cell wall biosynthesis